MRKSTIINYKWRFLAGKNIERIGRFSSHVWWHRRVNRPAYTCRGGQCSPNLSATRHGTGTAPCFRVKATCFSRTRSNQIQLLMLASVPSSRTWELESLALPMIKSYPLGKLSVPQSTITTYRLVPSGHLSRQPLFLLVKPKGPN